MSNPLLRTPFGQVELRPAAPPSGAKGMQTYVLLPDLDELPRSSPVFGLRDPDPGARQAPCAQPALITGLTRLTNCQPPRP
jgi:hypothetical protein